MDGKLAKTEFKALAAVRFVSRRVTHVGNGGRHVVVGAAGEGLRSGEETRGDPGYLTVASSNRRWSIDASVSMSSASIRDVDHSTFGA